MKKFLAIPLIASFLVAGAFTASAQVAANPNLVVTFQSAGVASTLNAGAATTTVANIRLDAMTSSEDVRIASLPITVSAGNGANAGDLLACRVVNAANPSVALNTGARAISSLLGGVNTVTFDSALIVPRGTIMNLYVVCNIDTDMVAGGTYQFSINTANVVATGATTGTAAVVGVTRTTGGVVVNPNPAPTVPGIPNTGFGGYASTNIALIFGSLMVAGLGLVYSRRFAR